MVDRNQIWKLKRKLEALHDELRYRHTELSEIIEDADCIPDNEEDFNKFYSTLKLYESDIEKINSMIILLKSHNTNIESQYNQIKLLKKRRSVKLESNLNLDGGVDDDDDLLPF